MWDNNDKLLDIAKDMDIEKTGQLAFLTIVTKGQLAYKKEKMEFMLLH